MVPQGQLPEDGGLHRLVLRRCPEAAHLLVVALAAFDRPVILLAGGKFKGGDVEGVRDLLKKHVRAVALYGASREHFEPAWKDVVPVGWDETMDQALARARTLAMPGDAVLLAPATSSYDQFKNYIERGNHFRALVTNMKEQ